MGIPWEMTEDQVGEFVRLLYRRRNHEISHEEFAEELTKLPGYPLCRQLMPGEEINIRKKARRPMVSVPRRSIWQP